MPTSTTADGKNDVWANQTPSKLDAECVNAATSYACAVSSGGMVTSTSLAASQSAARKCTAAGTTVTRELLLLILIFTSASGAARSAIQYVADVPLTSEKPWVERNRATAG